MHPLKPLDYQLQTLQLNLSHTIERELGNILCDPKVKAKGQIMFWLVNASSLETLDVATSNFAGAKFTTSRGYSHHSCDLRVKVKSHHAFVNIPPPKPLDTSTSNIAGA